MIQCLCVLVVLALLQFCVSKHMASSCKDPNQSLDIVKVAFLNKVHQECE